MAINVSICERQEGTGTQQSEAFRKKPNRNEKLKRSRTDTLGRGQVTFVKRRSIGEISRTAKTQQG
jgi:hypothetical protein